MMSYDKYAWHVASGGPRTYTWWVLRELPRGGREILEKKNGKTKYFKDRDYAQREADRLNRRDHNWTIEELEDLLTKMADMSQLWHNIVHSHIRALRGLELTSQILANEAERGYDVSRIGRNVSSA